jgi:hypothetical protein
METPVQNQRVKESEPGAKHLGNGSSLTTALESRSGQISRKASGPRTPAGKERSKHNARKHGIFSKVAVLDNESQPEFDSLLSGLQDDLNPEATLEQILVEKLATLVWRYRRLMVAEAAEIQKGAAFLEWDERERQEKEVQETSQDDPLDFGGDEVGLTRNLANRIIFEKCLDLLNELKDEFERNGFDSESNETILAKLYGSSGQCVETLSDSYQIWKGTAECSDEERKQNGYASVEQCKSHFLLVLQEEIRRLNRYKKAKASIEAERMRLESLRHNVPDAPQLDRLLRYEASLERSIDRTLTQLERLQRMRLGQPVTSPIKLDISSS